MRDPIRERKQSLGSHRTKASFGQKSASVSRAVADTAKRFKNQINDMEQLRSK
jgi:hypothetical protein